MVQQNQQLDNNVFPIVLLLASETDVVVAAVVVGIIIMILCVVIIVVIVWCGLRTPFCRAGAKQAQLSSPMIAQKELSTPVKEGDLEDVLPVVSNEKRPSYCYIAEVSIIVGVFMGKGRCG